MWEPLWSGLDIFLMTKGEVNILEKKIPNVLIMQCLLASVIFKAFRTSQK